MKLPGGKGPRSNRWYPNEIMAWQDVDFIREVDYTNPMATLQSMLASESSMSSIVVGGLELVWSAGLSFYLKAGAALSFAGYYLYAGTWGFVASPGDVFSVWNPQDVVLAVDAGGASDRIDVVEVRPVRTDYDQKSRNYKDPITRIITSALTYTKTEYGIETNISKGTALIKESATWTVNVATVGSDVAGKFVLFNTHLNAYYIWYDTGSSTDPAVALRIGIRVAVNAGDSYTAIALATRTALSAAIGVITAQNEILVGGASATFSVTVQKYADVVDATNGNMTTYFDAVGIVQGNGAPSTTSGWVKVGEVFVPASASSIGQNSLFDTDESGAWNKDPLSTIRALKSVLNQLRCLEALVVGDAVGAGFGNIYKMSNGCKQQTQITASAVGGKYMVTLVGGTYKKFICIGNSASNYFWMPLDFDENMVMYANMYTQTSCNGGRAAVLSESVCALPYYSSSTIGCLRGSFGATKHPPALGTTGPYAIEAVQGYLSIDAVALDSTYFIVSYNTISQSKVVCGLDGGSSFTYGSPVNVGGATQKEMYIAKLDSTHFIVMDCTSGDCYIGTLSGTAISLSSAFPFDGTIATGTGRIAPLDSKHFAIDWYNSAGPTHQILVGTLDAGYTTITGLTATPTNIPFTNTKGTKISFNVVPGTSFGLIAGNGEDLRRIVIDPVTYSPVIEAEIKTGLTITTNEGIAALDKNLYVLAFDGTSSYPQVYSGNPLTLMGFSNAIHAAGELGFAVLKGVCQLNVPPSDPIPFPGIAIGLRQNGSIGPTPSKAGWYTTDVGVSANRGSVLLA